MNYVLSEADKRAIQGLVEESTHRQLSKNRAEVKREIYTAPEVYIALTPPIGIAALSEELPVPGVESGSGTDIDFSTGTGDPGVKGHGVWTAGRGLCLVFRILDTGTPELCQVDRVEHIVYNHSFNSIPGDTWISIHRDKFGRWLAVAPPTQQPIRVRVYSSKLPDFASDENRIVFKQNGPLIIEGVTLELGDTLLNNGFDDAAHNGVWEVTRKGNGHTKCVLKRTVDCNTTAKMYPGLLVEVGPDGTVNKNTTWRLVTSDRTDPPFALNTTELLFECDAVDWVQVFSAAGMGTGSGPDIPFSNMSLAHGSANDLYEGNLYDRARILLGPIYISDVNGAVLAEGGFIKGLRTRDAIDGTPIYEVDSAGDGDGPCLLPAALTALGGVTGSFGSGA